MLKYNFEEMKRSQQHAHMKLMTNFSGREDLLEKEKNLRAAAEDELKQQIQKLKVDLQFEVKQREDADEKVRSMLKPMLEPLEDSINVKTKDMPTMRDTLGNLRNQIE